VPVGPPPPAPPADITAPTLSIDLKEPLGGTVDRGFESAIIVFPVITAKDSTGEAAKVTCSWEGKNDVPYSSDGFKAVFPVGETEVTCKATNGEGTLSKPARFTVTVCKPGVPFVNDACEGE
jgi:hypothetical protein